MLLMLLLLDAVVIVLLIGLVNQGQQMPVITAFISAAIISVGGVACILILGTAWGLFAFAPLLVIAILTIWMVSGVPLQRAVIAAAIFMVYKIGLAVAMSTLLR